MRDRPSIPDKKLRAAISAAFATDSRSAWANVRIGVLNGIVHLGGKVDTPAQWSVAADLARQVPGVRGVVNRIEAPGAPSPGRTIDLNLSDPR